MREDGVRLGEKKMGVGEFSLKAKHLRRKSFLPNLERKLERKMRREWVLMRNYPSTLP